MLGFVVFYSSRLGSCVGVLLILLFSWLLSSMRISHLRQVNDDYSQVVCGGPRPGYLQGGSHFRPLVSFRVKGEKLILVLPLGKMLPPGQRLVAVSSS